mmetsp:Transcript_110664/g.253485  ORF Transcript_110664/g.253485 Transcript_110664/m.253485 type:complete len:226 (-) Transcript_110664:2280-2957(-)
MTEVERPSRRPPVRCVASPAGTTDAPVSSSVSSFTRRSDCASNGCSSAAASVLDRALRRSDDLAGVGDCFWLAGGGVGSSRGLGLSTGFGGGEGSFASNSCRFARIAANTDPRPIPPAGLEGMREAAAAAAWVTQSCVPAPKGGNPSLLFGAATVTARWAPRNSDPVDRGMAMDVAAKLIPVLEGTAVEAHAGDKPLAFRSSCRGAVAAASPDTPVPGLPNSVTR